MPSIQTPPNTAPQLAYHWAMGSASTFDVDVAFKLSSFQQDQTPAPVPVRSETGEIRGELGDGLTLVRKLVITIETEGDGRSLASEDAFQNYGKGASPKQAVSDLAKCLATYYRLVESHSRNSPEDLAQSERVRCFIQPTGR